MAKNDKILFSSLKGGVGKSSAATAVAVALARDGYKTVIVDLDFRTRSLDIILGVSDNVIFTFDDYAVGRCSIDAVLIDVPLKLESKNAAGNGSLKLCPACFESQFEETLGDYGKIPEALKRLCNEAKADYIIFDTGADSRMPKLVADSVANLAIVVSEQSRTSVRAAEATAEALRKFENLKHVRLLINNFDMEAARQGGRAGIIDMIDGCSVKCIGVIPHDSLICSAQDSGVLPGKDSPVSKAASNISKRIQGITTPLFSGMKKERRRTIL